MPTPGRRKNTAVVDRLAQQPYGYPFYQAVRLLERASVLKTDTAPRSTTNPIARFTPPVTETIRFNTHQTLSFPSSEISTIKKKTGKTGAIQWVMDVNFMGITGAQTVLPYHYTEMVLQRLKLKDQSLRNFLNLFNHRIISLFYQAANKYRLPIAYERTHLNKKNKTQKDNHTQLLLSLIGLGTKNLTDRLYTRDESLLYYSGLLTQQIKTTSGLKQFLQNHFNVPIEIKEFIGQWQELIDDVRTKLPGKDIPQGQNNCLGRSAMMGKKGWFAQGKFRIIIGPLNKSQLKNFAPGTKSLKAIDEIVRLYAGMEYDYDFIIRIKRIDVPEKINLSSTKMPTIGWDTWLSSKSRNYNENETVDISVSAGRFR